MENHDNELIEEEDDQNNIGVTIYRNLVIGFVLIVYVALFFKFVFF